MASSVFISTMYWPVIKSLISKLNISFEGDFSVFNRFPYISIIEINWIRVFSSQLIFNTSLAGLGQLQPVFAENGSVSDATLLKQLDILAQQIVGFTRMRALDDLARVASTPDDRE